MHWLRHPRRRWLAVLQLILFLPACTSWRIEPLAPAEVIAKQPSPIRLTLSDSSHLTLVEPVIRGDILYGYRQKPDQSRAEYPDTVPLTRVSEIAVRRPDATKTTLFAVGLLVATFSALCLADALGCGPEEAFLTGPGQ